MLKFRQKSSAKKKKKDKNNCPFLKIEMNFFLEILTFFRLKHNAVNGKNMIFILLHNFFFIIYSENNLGFFLLTNY